MSEQTEKVIPNQIPPAFEEITKSWYSEATQEEMLKLWGCIEECTRLAVSEERERNSRSAVPDHDIAAAE